MEELLNKLIEKGWKPFGRYKEIFRTDYYEYYIAEEHGFGKRQYLRNLVSKESGLWQFVCENGMIKSETGVWVNGVNGMYKEILINQYDYRYRLIESSLKDESELEGFLLQNIKING